MSSSNNFFNTFASDQGSFHDPGFSAIVAFNYYDGPESGLALHPSGEGVRFTSLGDSKSRFFRAFELVSIDGNWQDEVTALQDAHGVFPPRRVLVPTESSDLLERLEQRVRNASCKGQFIGVGCPDLQWISITSVGQGDLGDLRKLGGSTIGFRSAHKLIKKNNWRTQI